MGGGAREGGVGKGGRNTGEVCERKGAGRRRGAREGERGLVVGALG